MLRMMPLFLLASLATPAFAVYKCESNSGVIYSDQPCPGGKVLDTRSAPPTDTWRQATEEKAKLKRLEHERHKREAQQEKEQQRAAHIAAAKQKRCSLLARRSKWANEDVAAASTGKAREKTRLKARRVAEQFDAECKT